MPKATVSRAIARLERTLGQQLFYRTTRRVTLTRAGRTLYKRCAASIETLRQAVMSVVAHDEEPSGVLRVTAPNDLGTSFLADAVTRFVARHPAVRVELELTARHVDLIAEGIDVALRAAPTPIVDTSLVARRLAVIDVQLFASPDYLTRRGTPRTARQLGGHDLVQFRGFRGPLRLRGPRRAEVAALTVRVVADDLAFVREALRAGAGIGLLPEFLARPDVAAGTLVRVLPRFAVPPATLYLVHPRTRHLPARVAAFGEFVAERLGAMRIGRLS